MLLVKYGGPKKVENHCRRGAKKRSIRQITYIQKSKTFMRVKELTKISWKTYKLLITFFIDCCTLKLKTKPW